MKTIYDKKDIIKQSQKISYGGIYFLVKDKEIIYIGCSQDNIYARIGAHKNKIDFDSFSTIGIKNTNKISSLEIKYIEKFNPIYNKTSNPTFFRNRKLNPDKVSLKVIVGKFIKQGINKRNLLGWKKCRKCDHFRLRMNFQFSDYWCDSCWRKYQREYQRKRRMRK